MEVCTSNFKSCMGFWGAGASNISYWKYATYCSRMRNCECIHFWKSKKEQFLLRILLDVLPFGLCVCIIFYFLFHHEVGVQTTLPWGMNIYESKFLYHPIFVYEIILALCIMGLLWMKNERLGNGKNISVFLIIEGFAHIIISLVSEQNSVLFGLSAEQIMSFCIISLGILLVPKK